MLVFQGCYFGGQPFKDVGVTGALFAGMDEGMFFWDF